jgi:signal transduction histidine kinase/CheY-like chemotaxis protein
VNGTPVIDERGHLTKVIVSFVNITDRKRAEEERLSLERQVQHSQKLESLGVLAGGIAHDFNNLLMAMLGNADLALEDISPLSPVRPSIEAIQIAGRRAADLTNQMLAYSGRGAFEIRQLDLSELVDEMIHLLESSTTKKAVLTTRLESDLPGTRGDPAQMQQVILNLIVNASEAIGDDEPGVVTVSTGVHVCSREYLATSYLDEEQAPGEYVYIEVADTGCGMNEEARAKLFDPFFSTKFTGRGLGLAAVLGIVRGHNGAIMVDTEPGKGTTFRVLFPAVAEEAKAPTPTGDLTKPDEWRGTGTVLVVDDEDLVRSLAVRMVKRLGFEVLQATDGQDAVEVFRKHADTITCVLLDLTMPRMDGSEACLEIQRIREDVPVILSSGYEESELSERFDGYGVAAFIQKPYQPSKLRGVLQSVLE